MLLTVILYGYEFIFKKPVIESPTVDETPEMLVTPLDVKEQYRDGKYTFAGSVQVPNPCYTLKSQANKIEEDEYQIQITTTPPKAGTMCAEVITDKQFKLTFEAPQDILVTATINGIEYNVNRFVVPADQNIDDFDLSVKG